MRLHPPPLPGSVALLGRTKLSISPSPLHDATPVFSCHTSYRPFIVRVGGVDILFGPHQPPRPWATTEQMSRPMMKQSAARQWTHPSLMQLRAGVANKDWWMERKDDVFAVDLRSGGRSTWSGYSHQDDEKNIDRMK